MKGIYLAAYKAIHSNYDIVYQDINGKRDIDGDMLTVDLSNYDYIIATPPCNYWSRANYRYKTSKYALETMHLLPDIINKLSQLDKPFIIENVINMKRWKEHNILNIINKYPNNIIYTVGRHVYITNQFINLNCKQQNDFKYIKNYGVVRLNKNTQGGDNVHNVIEIWLKYINNLTQNK